MLEILVADDDSRVRELVGSLLRREGHRVVPADDGVAALSLVTSRVFDLVIADVKLSRIDGLAVFRRVQQESPATAVILTTCHAAITEAVEALRQGATDYLTKPFEPTELMVRVDRVAARARVKKELEQAEAELASKSSLGNIIGRSPSTVRLRNRIETIAGSESPVMIVGESGTGKELVARSLHELGPRRNGPFVAVNCAAFPETLLEAELFGHERGAFTGAVRKRDGRFKAADGGTLFLDEVAEMPPAAQAKLLRVLQEGTVEPLGTNTAIKVDVRILSATHRDLKKAMASGAFREDLYYRLNVLDVHVAPLRERRGDLPLLIQHFIQQLQPPGRPRPGISPAAWAALNEYPFPGNVRELEHAIEHALVLCKGSEIRLEHLPATISGLRAGSEGDGGGSGFLPLAVAMREYEREYLLRALASAEGKKTRAAELLGISRKNLWEKLKAHGILNSEFDETGTG